jgi:hypothetical protein
MYIGGEIMMMPSISILLLLAYSKKTYGNGLTNPHKKTHRRSKNYMPVKAFTSVRGVLEQPHLGKSIF